MNDLDEHDNSRAERSMQEPNREVQSALEVAPTITRAEAVVTVTDSPLIAHADPAMTQALESSIDNRTMAGITDGRFSNIL